MFGLVHWAGIPFLGNRERAPVGEEARGKAPALTATRAKPRAAELMASTVARVIASSSGHAIESNSITEELFFSTPFYSLEKLDPNMTVLLSHV